MPRPHTRRLSTRRRNRHSQSRSRFLLGGLLPTAAIGVTISHAAEAERRSGSQSTCACDDRREALGLPIGLLAAAAAESAIRPRLLTAVAGGDAPVAPKNAARTVDKTLHAENRVSPHCVRRCRVGRLPALLSPECRPARTGRRRSCSAGATPCVLNCFVGDMMSPEKQQERRGSRRQPAFRQVV
jgi:hypothetical protein